ncbi:CpaF family protein [Paratractidigestivibacter sp.]|uniref:CpaF family protein n=1 Tax=Paratractidigestivibacter sp. TaxID=2847316 RepID=UPI002ABD5C11|nr:CpaF family protein [Paratractidigestivibacter sp.]
MSVLERVQEAEAAQGVADSAGEQLTSDLRHAREQLKRDLIERLGLATIAGMLGEGDSDRPRSELTVALEAILNTGGYEGLAPDDRRRLVREVVDEVCGLGPIQGLLDDPEVTEVMINGTASLFFEKGGELVQSDVSFDSPEQITITIDRILAPLGRRLDRSSPLVNARLANGDRVNAVARPVAIDGPSVTIRKFTDSIRSLGKLEELGALPHWYAQLLSWAVSCRKSIAVSGGTGSGKTTLLNALSCEIPVGERIVTIEDSAELRFDAHPNVVRLEAQDASIEGLGAVSIRDLVKNALRMRPDRIVVGEVRGEEAIDMLQAMNTGHDGSLTTLHAGTPEETVMRLVLMARFGMDLPPELIEEQVATALDLIVMSRRLKDGRRAITELAEVSRREDGRVGLTVCVEYRLRDRTWHLVREPGFLAEAMDCGFLGKEEVETWRRSCSLR